MLAIALDHFLVFPITINRSSRLDVVFIWIEIQVTIVTWDVRLSSMHKVLGQRLHRHLLLVARLLHLILLLAHHDKFES